MTIDKTKPLTIRILAVLLTFHVLLAYGLPGEIFAPLILVLGLLYFRIQALNAVTTTLSLVAATLLYGLALKLTGYENAIYYRPDEILTEYREDLGHRAYRRGETVRMHMPHGDLQPMTSAKIGVAHDVEYHIDGYGFRNDADYANEAYVLVGDSFITGSSNTQADILSAQLKQDYGLAGYNLAHAGDLADYADYVEAFSRDHRGFRIIVFLFEGNDFEPDKDIRRSTLLHFMKQYSSMFSKTNVYRVTKSLIKRAMRRSQIGGESYVTLREIRGQQVAFLTRYIEATRVRELPKSERFENALSKLKPYRPSIFFIPTNYRVYYHALEGKQAPALPDANWEYLKGLCTREGLACTNLTAPLVRSGETLLEKGEPLWWPDDTHWNRRGMAVAARVVAETLKQETPAAKVMQKK